VPEFLSEAWFASLARALAGVALDLPGVPEGAITIGQIVTGVPDGARASGVRDSEVRYTIVFDGGAASLVRGSIAGAQVVLVTDWDSAEEISSGRSSVPEMLNAGKIKVRGEASALVAAGDFLARIAPMIAASRQTS
jgi:hypothetical protein